MERMISRLDWPNRWMRSERSTQKNIGGERNRQLERERVSTFGEESRQCGRLMISLG